MALDKSDREFLKFLDHEVTQLAIAAVSLQALSSLVREDAPDRALFVAGIHNALVESIAIHMRSVSGFLECKGQEDELFARHFLPEWTAAPVLSRPERKLVNKEITHLTFERKAPGDPSKGWGVLVPLHVLYGAAGFYKAINRELPQQAQILMDDAAKRGLRLDRALFP